MKVVILCGGLGTRLAEETEVRPKPMVEIGGRPILWHIMKHYAHFGFNEFVDRPGLQGRGHQAVLPRLPHASTADMTRRSVARAQLERHAGDIEDWTVHLVGHRHEHA